MKASKRFVIEVEREVDGRWIAEIPVLPGVLAYGATRKDALARVKALALRVLAERLEHGETAGEQGTARPGGALALGLSRVGASC